MITVEVSPPKDNTWPELLRFYCQQADSEDPSLPFMASMWSYALNTGGLTGRQAESAERYIVHAFKSHGLSFDGADNNG